jgi:hypothetical protein
MKGVVREIAVFKIGCFPFGKSLFVFPCKNDTLYFTVYKEGHFISVLEIYDEILNKVPDCYQILPQVNFYDLVFPQPANLSTYV